MQNNKICLIIPDSTFLLDSRVFVFLGILKVASAFEQKGFKVDVIDLSGIQNYLEVIDDYFAINTDLLFVGLTATTPQMPAAFDVAKRIKEIQPNVKLVLGGSHVTLMHTASKHELKRGVVGGRSFIDVEKIKDVFDILVCGDGEMTLDAILEMEKGVIDVDDRFSPMFLTNETFSSTPSPARHLVDMSSYHYTIEGHKSVSIIAQLGCPYKCTFCSGRSSPYLRMIRNRTVESIIQELEHLHVFYGYTGFMFYDDELNVSKSMIPLMNAISDLQMKYGVEFRLRGFIKSELFNEQQAKSMYQAGFRWLLCGYESGDERILKNIEKQATRDDNTKCVEIAKKAGLKVKALMSCMHAGETEKTIENTKNWLLEVQPDDFDLTTISPYPGSPYYDFAVKSDDDVYVYTQPKTGDKLYQKNLDYSKDIDYYKGVPGSYVAYCWSDFLTPIDGVKLRDEVEAEVRSKLNIPFNPSNPAVKYEHSMGQGNALPDWILRSTENFKQQSLPNKKKSLSVVK